jgi:hypothetical protein
LKPTPEQYRETAVSLVDAGVPLKASSGPGDLVQEMAHGERGAFVTVNVFVPEALAVEYVDRDAQESAERLRKLTADEPLPDDQRRRAQRQFITSPAVGNAAFRAIERLEAMNR